MSKDESKELSPAEKKKQIETLKKEIIVECKKLATFKVSSAVHINEKTKQLLRLEGKA